MSQLSGNDGDADVVRSWCEVGDVYALVDVGAGPGAPLPAAAVVVPRDQGTVELARLVAPGPDGPDLVRRMLAELFDSLRRSEAQQLIAATNSAQYPLMTLLQEAGFRLAAVAERDGCTTGPGVPARDLVWFTHSL